MVRFEIKETEDLTTIRGYDAEGNDIARVNLVHGRFELTGVFKDEYPTPDVVGRRLDVDVLGQKTVWETAGFAPTLHMPAHPPSQWAIAALLEDPHVKPTLERWQIGYEPSAGIGEELAYDTGGFAGFEGGITCDGETTCSETYAGNINTCGGSTAAIKAALTVKWNNVYLPTQTRASHLAQCCPPSQGYPAPWWGKKFCPHDASMLNTECGTASGACKGCNVYMTSSCNVWRSGNNVYWNFTEDLQ